MYLQQQQAPKATDLQNRIQDRVQLESDPKVLSELYKMIDNFLDQTNLNKQELLMAKSRYNSTPANNARRQWAMEWLVG